MSDDTVECGLHGRQPISFVCTHIGHGLLDGSTPGFVIAPEDDHPLPLAWCDTCEAMVESLGGDWNEEASGRADFKLFAPAAMPRPRAWPSLLGVFATSATV